MKSNALRDTMQLGQPALNAWCAMASTHAIEILAQLDFDSITIDLQHGAMDGADAFRMLQAISGRPITPLVRVPWNMPSEIMKALDAGAEGIICPMINTADEAAQFVGACRYPPDGYRSFGPTRAALANGAQSSADYAANANAEILTLAMIETRDGLKNLDAILAVDGLDGIYIGPGDLSLALGARPSMRQKPGTPQADAVIEAIDRCLKHARAAGRFAAIHTDGNETARIRFEEGFHLCTLQSDARLLSDAAKAQIASCRTDLQR
ncbi:MAG: aldolase/citrate lyase family protein [Pseudomonadota bacterium]